MARPRGLGWWVGGTSVALAGVAIVRLVAPRAGDLSVPAYLAGFTLAILGLFLITLGTRQRT
jgi:drug/metabolite transporter (DMT)-like permease